MGRSQETFNKKEIRLKKEKKRKEKEQKKIERKENSGNSNFNNMIAYVDEFGMISSTPPDPDRKMEIKAEDIVIGIPKTDPSLKADPYRKGVVTFFNDSKGYGFIRDMETRESLFVHAINLLEPIKENNMVEFIREKGTKGAIAVSVKIIRS